MVLHQFHGAWRIDTTYFHSEATFQFDIQHFLQHMLSYINSIHRKFDIKFSNSQYFNILSEIQHHFKLILLIDPCFLALQTSYSRPYIGLCNVLWDFWIPSYFKLHIDLWLYEIKFFGGRRYWQLEVQHTQYNLTTYCTRLFQLWIGHIFITSGQDKNR